MKKLESDFGFKVMAWTYKVRDFLHPRKNILIEAKIQPGFHVLDYACGPGCYIVDASSMVGTSGRVHALDIHPMAHKMVTKLIEKKDLKNVTAIISDCKTGLPDKSIDRVLLYDALHDLDNPDKILAELHRVLKDDGMLSFSDHHLDEAMIISELTEKGLFELENKNNKTYDFVKR